ncbi:MAG: Prolyl-tRNA synthetase [Microgenomates bacterium 39_7]|nr:MAG: Prolyl-tRNA synthetase [Microgenomates bacterium 39_7]
MRLSQLAFKPLKEAPSDADTKNHQLLVQAGYVRQLMAGVYTYTPLGLRVLDKIRNIIRQEMNSLGAQEVLMPMLHPKQNWLQTGGWDNIDVLFKIVSRTKKEYALGQSHEEVVTPLAKEVILSYRDLPLALYQIHWKFRDELRAKSGILRGKEFEMKDMYSWHETQENFEMFFNQVKSSYIQAFKKVGLIAKVTEASGGSFSQKISYEFMVLTDAGEDDIFYCDNCDYCVNKEIAQVKEGDTCPKCQGSKLQLARASEVGNVFDLGQKYTKDFDLTYMDDEGTKHYPIMGCYGWGTTRTMGVIVEKYNDEKGIMWPQSVAPFDAILINVNLDPSQAEEIYQSLSKQGIEVLWDDRDNESAGSKFADADLLGIPYRLVISNKTGSKVEIKKRTEKEVKLVELGLVKDAIAI